MVLLEVAQPVPVGVEVGVGGGVRIEAVLLLPGVGHAVLVPVREISEEEQADPARDVVREGFLQGEADLPLGEVALAQLGGDGVGIVLDVGEEIGRRVGLVEAEPAPGAPAEPLGGRGLRLELEGGGGGHPALPGLDGEVVDELADEGALPLADQGELDAVLPDLRGLDPDGSGVVCAEHLGEQNGIFGKFAGEAGRGAGLPEDQAPRLPAAAAHLEGAGLHRHPVEGLGLGRAFADLLHEDLAAGGREVADPHPRRRRGRKRQGIGVVVGERGNDHDRVAVGSGEGQGMPGAGRHGDLPDLELRVEVGAAVQPPAQGEVADRLGRAGRRGAAVGAPQGGAEAEGVGADDLAVQRDGGGVRLRRGEDHGLRAGGGEGRGGVLGGMGEAGGLEGPPGDGAAPRLHRDVGDVDGGGRCRPAEVEGQPQPRGLAGGKACLRPVGPQQGDGRAAEGGGEPDGGIGGLDRLRAGLPGQTAVRVFAGGGGEVGDSDEGGARGLGVGDGETVFEARDPDVAQLEALRRNFAGLVVEQDDGGGCEGLAEGHRLPGPGLGGGLDFDPVVHLPGEGSGRGRKQARNPEQGG